MNDEIIDLTPLEQKINALIFKAGYFIHKGSGDRYLNHLYTNKKWHAKP